MSLVTYKCLSASSMMGFAGVAAKKPLKTEPTGLIALTLTKECVPMMVSRLS